MDFGSRGAIIASILSGVLVALVATIALMALLAAAIVQFDISDAMITSINQLIKILAILAGCRVCVGRGGDKGFAKGAATGLLYMVAGYALYCLLGGEAPSSLLLTCEFALGALIGAFSGALVANLRPRQKTRPGKSAARS
ncbi:MAG: TIGR04086 family membrane protein [Clostridia bacterium]|nr:TIGR04086 family membrane protein [Clostridia bacterium]